MTAWMSATLLTAIILLSSLTVAPRHHHLSVVGATSVIAYLRAAIPGWERQHPEDSVTLSGGGSVAGLVEVSRGRADIGVADIPPRPEWTQGVALQQSVLGRLPILFIENPDIPLREISLHQLRSVISGRVSNWRTLGGPDEPIVVVARPISSGALWVVKQHILGRAPLSPHAIIQLSNGAVLAVVRETPGALGFIESGTVPRAVTTLEIGKNRYHRGANEADWPYYAVPTLFYRDAASQTVTSLVHYLTSHRERSEYGILEKSS